MQPSPSPDEETQTVEVTQGVRLTNIATPPGFEAYGYADGSIAVWDGTAHVRIEIDGMTKSETQRSVNAAIYQLRRAAKERKRA